MADRDAAASPAPFWETKTLEEMTPAEWESLCDGCGRCCLMKFHEPGAPDEVFYTDVGCRLLDLERCRCRDYPNRHEHFDDCVQLTPDGVRTATWLPPTCGYRLVAQGRGLYWWHPLVSGDPDSVRAAGISVRGRARRTESDFADPAKIEARERAWPQRWPPGSRRR